MHERERRRRPAEEQGAERARATLPTPLARVVALQRSAGNRAVAAMLARHGDHDGPEQAAGGAGTAPALSQAGQEAEALETLGRLHSVHQLMLASPDERTRTLRTLSRRRRPPRSAVASAEVGENRLGTE